MRLISAGLWRSAAHTSCAGGAGTPCCCVSRLTLVRAAPPGAHAGCGGGPAPRRLVAGLGCRGSAFRPAPQQHVTTLDLPALLALPAPACCLPVPAEAPLHPGPSPPPLQWSESTLPTALSSGAWSTDTWPPRQASTAGACQPALGSLPLTCTRRRCTSPPGSPASLCVPGPAPNPCSPPSGARRGPTSRPGRLCAVWQDRPLAARLLLRRSGGGAEGHAGRPPPPLVWLPAVRSCWAAPCSGASATLHGIRHSLGLLLHYLRGAPQCSSVRHTANCCHTLSQPDRMHAAPSWAALAGRRAAQAGPDPGCGLQCSAGGRPAAGHGGCRGARACRQRLRRAPGGVGGDASQGH